MAGGLSEVAFVLEVLSGLRLEALQSVHGGRVGDGRRLLLSATKNLREHIRDVEEAVLEEAEDG